jgi:hypothetical protein
MGWATIFNSFTGSFHGACRFAGNLFFAMLSHAARSYDRWRPYSY